MRLHKYIFKLWTTSLGQDAMDDIITAAMVIPGGVLLGIIILSFLQYHIRNNSVPCINPHKLKFFFRRFVSDFLLHRYLRSVGLATPLYLFALLLILAINTIVLTISKDPAVLRQRSGEAVLVNIILLLVCGRPNVFSERVHVSQQFKNFIHRWLGIIAMVECIVHLTAALTPIHSSTRPFSSVSSGAGLTVSHNQISSKVTLLKMYARLLSAQLY